MVPVVYGGFRYERLVTRWFFWCVFYGLYGRGKLSLLNASYSDGLRVMPNLGLHSFSSRLLTTQSVSEIHGLTASWRQLRGVIACVTRSIGTRSQIVSCCPISLSNTNEVQLIACPDQPAPFAPPTPSCHCTNTPSCHCPTPQHSSLPPRPACPGHSYPASPHPPLCAAA